MACAGGEAQGARNAGGRGAAGERQRHAVGQQERAANRAREPHLAGVDQWRRKSAPTQQFRDTVGDCALSDAVQGERPSRREADLVSAEVDPRRKRMRRRRQIAGGGPPERLDPGIKGALGAAGPVERPGRGCRAGPGPAGRPAVAVEAAQLRDPAGAG